MIYIAGIILIIIGFVWPFLTGWSLTLIVFPLGILALLSPGRYIPKTANWNKWARAGLLGYLLVVLIHWIISYLAVASPVFCNTWGGCYLAIVFSWISAPVDLLLSRISPLETIQLPDGGWQIRISYIRATTSNFMSIIVYLLAGILIGKWLQVRRSKC